LRLPQLSTPPRLRMDRCFIRPPTSLFTDPSTTLSRFLLQSPQQTPLLARTLYHIPRANHPINPHTCQRLQIEAVELPWIIGRTSNLPTRTLTLIYHTAHAQHYAFQRSDTSTNLDHTAICFSSFLQCPRGFVIRRMFFFHSLCLTTHLLLIWTGNILCTSSINWAQCFDYYVFTIMISSLFVKYENDRISL